MRWRTALCLVLVSMAPEVASPQSPADYDLSILVPGSRVRITTTTVGEPLKGTILSRDDEALTLMIEGRGPLRLALPTLTAVEISAGRKTTIRKGLLIGLAIGVASAFAFPVDGDYCGGGRSGDYYCSRGDAVATGAFSGAVTGAIVGLIVKSDRWAPLPRTPAAALGPRPRLYGEVAFRF